MPQECAFDLATACAGGLRNNQQSGARVGRYLPSAPDCTGVKLGLRVCGRVKMNFSGRFVVRVSPDLHKKAALKALARNESLNQFVADAIAKA